MIRTVTFLVSVPPSANNIHGNRADGKGRFNTSEYKAWISRAETDVMATKEGRWPSQLTKEHYPWLTLACGINFTRDASNCIKPVEDLMKRWGVIKDDRWFEGVKCFRARELNRDAGTLWQRGNTAPGKDQVLVTLEWWDIKKA